MIFQDKEFLSIKQVSQFLKIPLRTVYRLVNQGKIKSIRFGGKIRCFKEDIERCYRSGTDFSCEPHRRYNDFIEKSDRRSCPRINSNISCRYSINIPPFKNFYSSGLIKNISAGGVFLVDYSDNTNIDDPIDLNFKIENEENLINIKGRIIRKDNDGMGIKFRNINEDTKNKIVKYIG